MEPIAYILVAIPFLYTAWNIYSLIYLLITKKDKAYRKYTEIAAILTGIYYFYLYIEIAGIKSADWFEQIYNSEKHSVVYLKSVPTLITFLSLALVGYIILSFIKPEKQPPLITALGIATQYIGACICVLWCIQTYDEFFLVLFPANLVIVFFKTIFITVYSKSVALKENRISVKRGILSSLLCKSSSLPWIALLFTIPLTGIVTLILVLFGQEPDALIKAWTETADWKMSQKIPPQNIYMDEHYLCTVAAGGHRKVVRPLRTGLRHGHRVVVNRQLCVANAFEQLIQERTPRFHKVVRRIYDSTGYFIARHIRSKYTADIIYCVMKPLELVFLVVLYLFDVKPENRIAVQYPHSAPPENK